MGQGRSNLSQLFAMVNMLADESGVAASFISRAAFGQ